VEKKQLLSYAPWVINYKYSPSSELDDKKLGRKLEAHTYLLAG